MKEFLIFALFLSSLSAHANLYGKDDRIRAGFDNPIHQQVVSIVGQKGADNSWRCTGSAVASNIVLTNAHCLAPALDERGKISHAFFIITELEKSGEGLEFKEKIEVVNYVWGFSKKESKANDWALLILKEPTFQNWFNLAPSPKSELAQWFEKAFKQSKSNESSKNQAPITLTGYHGDLEEGFQLYTQTNCHFRNLVPGRLLEHDCDSAMGTSGSPIYRCNEAGCFIIALYQGHAPKRGDEKNVNSVLRDSDSGRLPSLAVKTDDIIKALEDLK